MSWTWEKYLDLLRELDVLFGQMTAVEQAKTEAVCRGDLQTVNDCIKKEQAMSLSLRGCDKKREEALQALGIENIKLSQLAAHAPENLRQETRQIADDVFRQYTVLRAANEVAQNTLECNLREIDKVLSGAQQAPKNESSENNAESVPHKKTDFRV